MQDPKTRQKSLSGHHPTNLSGYIFATKAYIDNRKNMLCSNISSTCPYNGELRRTSGWDRLTSLGHPCKFQLVSRLGSVTARHLVVSVSQTSRHWTEGATYIRQGDHHVGHWPTFIVNFWVFLEPNRSISAMMKWHFIALIYRINFNLKGCISKYTIRFRKLNSCKWETIHWL